MPKRTIKISELVSIGRPVDVSEGEQIMVRALNLEEVIVLFTDSKDMFLALYEAAIKDSSPEQLMPFIIASPEFVARIIAMATDESESVALIQKHMPATVQLVALSEIWKASVPDPKKAKELLSEVTALLQKLDDENKKTPAPVLISSPTTSPPE